MRLGRPGVGLAQSARRPVVVVHHLAVTLDHLGDANHVVGAGDFPLDVVDGHSEADVKRDIGSQGPDGDIEDDLTVLLGPIRQGLRPRFPRDFAELPVLLQRMGEIKLAPRGHRSEQGLVQDVLHAVAGVFDLAGFDVFRFRDEVIVLDGGIEFRIVPPLELRIGVVQEIVAVELRLVGDPDLLLIHVGDEVLQMSRLAVPPDAPH